MQEEKCLLLHIFAGVWLLWIIYVEVQSWFVWICENTFLIILPSRSLGEPQILVSSSFPLCLELVDKPNSCKNILGFVIDLSVVVYLYIISALVTKHYICTLNNVNDMYRYTETVFSSYRESFSFSPHVQLKHQVEDMDGLFLPAHLAKINIITYSIYLQ